MGLKQLALYSDEGRNTNVAYYYCGRKKSMEGGCAHNVLTDKGIHASLLKCKAAETGDKAERQATRVKAGESRPRRAGRTRLATFTYTSTRLKCGSYRGCKHGDGQTLAILQY